MGGSDDKGCWLQYQLKRANVRKYLQLNSSKQALSGYTGGNEEKHCSKPGIGLSGILCLRNCLKRQQAKQGLWHWSAYLQLCSFGNMGKQGQKR